MVGADAMKWRSDEAVGSLKFEIKSKNVFLVAFVVIWKKNRDASYQNLN